jgi:phosphate transport system substrate-binding protein
MSKILLCAALAAAFVGGGAPSLAGDISGAGATFPYPIYSKWADTYKKNTGIGMNYQSIGSGGGIKQIIARTVTFGATDAPMKADELDKNGLVQWPQVMGGIVVVFNLDGIRPGDLVIDGATLARIFLGEIKAWNDPALVKLNPGLKLPDAAIVVVHRAEGSGTSFNFTNYLAEVSPDWKSRVGVATVVDWPVGLAAKGNEGVANTVANTKSSVGYVEYAYAKQNKLSYSRMVNRDGKTVAPTSKSFQAAAANADWANAPGYYQILTDQKGAASWPMTAATFILIPKQPADPASAGEALKFFDWAFRNGAREAEALDYIPMPDNVIGMIRKTWAAEVKTTDGKPVYETK